MKKELYYGKLEKITYTFDESEIKKALMYYFKIPNKGEMEFNMWDSELDQYGDYMGPGGAELIVKVTKDWEKDESQG